VGKGIGLAVAVFFLAACISVWLIGLSCRYIYRGRRLLGLVVLGTAGALWVVNFCGFMFGWFG
jgi:hypothetical protein